MHGEQEARGHLWHRCTGIEQRRGGVSEVSLTHQVIGAEGFLDVSVMNAHGDAHQHVLWTLSNLAIQLEQVGALKRLESEVVIVVVSAVIDVIVEHIGIGHNDIVDFFGDERCVFP